jgi:NADH-quinone oxidoreductase subunit M
MGAVGMFGAQSAFNPLWPMVCIPLLAACCLALVPAVRGDIIRQFAILASLISGALSISVLADFNRADAGMQMVTSVDWIRSLGVHWSLGVDGISLFLVVLTGVLFPIALLAIKPEHDPKPYYLWLLVLMSGSFGVFLAQDLLVFFAFFEIVLVPMYFLIGLWGHGDRIYAATKFFLYTMVGSALMLVAIVATAIMHQRGAGGPITFDLMTIAQDQAIGAASTRWLFAAFALAFAVKVPLFPLHTWLPDAHTEAPTAGSMILAGVMLKLGTYGLVRFGVYLFPAAAKWWAPVMLTLAVIGIVWGAVCATMQTDLKRLVAYSSVAHLGFIVLGIFSLTSAGITGGVIQMVNHGITTPALFLMVGLLYDRLHTRQIADLGGIQSVTPVFSGFFMVVMLASVGLPGLNGFVGEYLALLGGYFGAKWWSVVAVAGVILAALYLLWAYQRVFHGQPNELTSSMPELRLREGLVLFPLVALMVFGGLYPRYMTERIEPSVDVVIEQVAEHAGHRVQTLQVAEPDQSEMGAGQ